ncbi:MAG: PHP domain-containing protein [Syntrophales bacterium]|nr:PHP domain-containing protein [Syntrophales bacterium]
MLRSFRCDLHIHTCLSPCAELDMTPRAIVASAKAKGLDMIAICDHNASENVIYVQRAATDEMITVLPGMEVTSSEEVHVLAFFENLDALDCFQQVVYRHLTGINNEAVFGCQAIVNDRDEVEGINDRLLMGATTLTIQEVITGIHRAGGLAIAAHVDRPSFSVMGHLGFIDPTMPFDALEVTPRMGSRRFRSLYPELSRFPIIESSDAHFLRDIGRGATTAYLEAATFAELRKALQSWEGRYMGE